MWLVVFFDGSRLCLGLRGMVAVEMQFLLLPLHGTGWSWTVSDRLFHAVQAETDTEQHEGEHEGKEQLGVP